MAGTVKKAVLIVSGLVFLTLGVTGLLLPIVPATPFLLLAAWCFARSSDKLYAKLKNNRLIGSFIREFMGRRIVRKRVIKTALIFLWLSVIIALFLVKNPWLRLLILAFGLAISLILRQIKRTTMPGR
jgi:uncharacterized membrane protein YbaN (DUF454 family)